MPTVPGYTGAPSVAPATGGGQTFLTSSTGTPEAFGAGIGRAEGEVGAALAKAGDVAENYVLTQQKLYNEAAAKDLDVSSMEKIGQAQTDFYSRTGADALSAHPKYVEAVQKIRQDALAAAPNQQVARILDQQLSRRVGYALVDGGRHLATETKKYAVSTSKARVALATSDAASAEGPRFDDELARISGEVDSQSRTLGWSPEETEQNKREALTKAWAGKLSNIATTDPDRAMRVFTRYRDSMDGLQALQIEKMLINQQRTVGARNIADIVVNGGAGFDNAVRTTFGFEGGLNRRDTNGTPSNFGINQAANPDVDVTKISKDDAKQLYKERYWDPINADSLPPNMQTMAFDTAVIAGVGKAKELLADAGNDPVKFMKLRTDFLNGLIERDPEKYGKYAKAWDNRNQVLSRQAVGVSPDTKPQDVEQAVAQARALADQKLPGDPVMADAVESRVRTKFNQVKNAAMQQDRDNKEAVNNIIFGDPDHPPKSIDEVIADPDVAKAWNDLKPADQAKYIKTLAKLQDNLPMTPERLEHRDELNGLGDTDPQAFVNADIAHDDELDRATKNQLIQRQKQLKNTMQADPKIGHAISVLRTNGVFGAAHIDPSKTGKENRSYNLFMGQLSAQMKAYQESTGKFPDDDKIVEMATKLTAVQPGSGINLGFTTIRDKPDYEVSAGKIRDLFIQKYKREPTSAEISTIYSNAVRNKK